MLDQAHARILRVLEGKQVPALEKVLSLFEAHTRVVMRAKAGVPIAFGRQVVFDEVEGGLLTRFHVLTDDESACHQALPAVQQHVAAFGHPLWLVAGDRRLHTTGVEQTAQDLGLTQSPMWSSRASARLPPRSGPESSSAAGAAGSGGVRASQDVSTACDGMMACYGLVRRRSHSLGGLERDVGWGGLASDLRHIAVAQARRPPSAARPPLTALRCPHGSMRRMRTDRTDGTDRQRGSARHAAPNARRTPRNYWASFISHR